LQKNSVGSFVCIKAWKQSLKGWEKWHETSSNQVARCYQKCFETRKHRSACGEGYCNNMTLLTVVESVLRFWCGINSSRVEEKQAVCLVARHGVLDIFSVHKRFGSMEVVRSANILLRTVSCSTHLCCKEWSHSMELWCMWQPALPLFRKILKRGLRNISGFCLRISYDDLHHCIAATKHYILKNQNFAQSYFSVKKRFIKSGPWCLVKALELKVQQF
jgi:hypothetical protein